MKSFRDKMAELAPERRQRVEEMADKELAAQKLFNDIEAMSLEEFYDFMVLHLYLKHDGIQFFKDDTGITVNYAGSTKLVHEDKRFFIATDTVGAWLDRDLLRRHPSN